MDYFRRQAENSSAAASGRMGDFHAPRSDEFEITVIGQGVGESIVVHFGNGKWLIVDTFEIAGQDDGQTLLPAPAQYLADIDVDIEQAVTAVCITHPHSDHYGGLADLMQSCTAEGGDPPWLYWPEPLHPKVWAKIDDASPGTSRAMLRDVYETARKRPSTVRYLSHTKKLDPPMSAMTALSPLPGASTAINHEGRANFYENLSSIAMWLACHGVVALLGADLDDHPDFGWRGLVEEQAKTKDPSLPPGFGMIKVPHHGSKTAGSPAGVDAIRRFAHDDPPVAVFTRHSTSGLPNEDVLTRYEPWSETVVLGNPADPRFPIGWATFRASEADDRWKVETYGAIDIPTKQAKGR